MSKYINADEIKNDIKTLWDWETVDGIKSSTVLKQVLSDIDNINEAVVRCKDCKYYSTDNMGYCNKLNSGLMFAEENDFCSYGERRGENAEI